MAKVTKDAILRRAELEGIRFVRLQFTDILGVVKNVAVPVSRLEDALDDKIMFDGSSIEGFARVEESDMNLRPDYATFTPFPWRMGEAGGVARLVCDVFMPTGEPFAGDPRHALRRALDAAKTLGFHVHVGGECEFFLFRKDSGGRPTTVTHDEAGYFDLGPADRGEDVRRDIVLALEEMGFEVEGSHHEVSPGQHEVGFHHEDALAAADLLATFKVVTRAIAVRRGLHATFMPKPLFGQNGSGLHTHLALATTDGRNAFYDSAAPDQLSDVARHFIAGLLAHAPALTAVTNPLVNSYKRLLPGYEAPVYIFWSTENRGALVRIPTLRQQRTRIELRSPDMSCNPYLALAAVVRAGLDGIERRLDLPKPVDDDPNYLTRSERLARGIRRLPANLQEAVDALEQDPVILDALGPHIASRFIEAKRIEWDVYSSQVHPWEVEQYLNVF